MGILGEDMGSDNPTPNMQDIEIRALKLQISERDEQIKVMGKGMEEWSIQHAQLRKDLTAALRLNGEIREFVEKHSTCLGNICRFDGSRRCHEVIVAQMNGYTEKRNDVVHPDVCLCPRCGFRAHDGECDTGPKCRFCGQPPHIGICAGNTRGY